MQFCMNKFGAETGSGSGSRWSGSGSSPVKSNQIKSNNFIYTRLSHQYIFMNWNIYKTFNTMNLKLKTTNKLSSTYL